MKYRTTPAILAIICAFALCGFTAPQPKRTPPPTAPPIPVSTVSATLKISGDDLIAMLNERTKTQLAKVEGQDVNCVIQKCQLNLLATRTGAITGRPTGSGMALKLPFALHAQLSFDSKYLKTGGDAVAQGEADATTQLKLGRDWRMAAHTEGEVHLSNANLKLGPLKMSVTELWNNNSDQLSTPIFKAIDKRIAAAFRLRGQAEKMWRRLQQPTRIGKNPDTWLVMAPQRLRVTPLKTEDGALVVSLAAEVRARAAVGSQPAAPAAFAKLPPPETLDAPSNTFQAAVPVTLTYSDAARLAMEQLKKKPLRAAGINLNIDKMQILPSGQDLVVQTHFCVANKWDFTHLLDSCGDVYLRGTPHFDAHSGKLAIANLHYDVASQNLMLRVTRALAGDAFSKALQPHLVFDESRDIARLKAGIINALAKPQGRGILLSGHISSFGDPKLSWTKDGFLALLTAKGTVSADLNLKQPL
ncbi:MAG TPA: DUF4403 family protein [Rhizomicrobium sp.]|nr:DUF4403 family protein [Rhizomicrobium sp.]